MDLLAAARLEVLVIVIVGSQADFLSVVLPAAQRFDEVEMTLSWKKLSPTLLRARAAVFLAPHPEAEEIEQIAALHRRFPLLPLFLVTHAGSQEFALIYGAKQFLAAVIWDDRLSDIDRALGDSLSRRPWERLFDLFSRRPEVPPKCLEALELICIAQNAPTTFEGIAHRVDIAASTLRRQWVLHMSATATPKELQEWVLLLRWVELSPTMTLAQAARVLRVDPRTIERIAKRRANRTAIACAQDQDMTASVFERWVRAAF